MGMYTKKVEEALGLKEKNNNEFYGEYLPEDFSY